MDKKIVFDNRPIDAIPLNIGPSITNIKFAPRRDTLTNWQESNPILISGEIGLIIDENNNDKVIGVKIGNGKTNFNDLENAIITKTDQDMFKSNVDIKLVELQDKIRDESSLIRYDCGKNISILNDKLEDQGKYIFKLRKDIKNLSITLWTEAAMIVGILIYTIAQ